MLTVAAHWSKKHTVTVFWDDTSILERAKERFGLDLTNIKITRNIFWGNNVFKKLFLTRQYDMIFFLSDGSIPSTLAKYNILHYQVPFPAVGYSAVKFSRYQAVVCNSEFTKRFLDIRVSNRAMVIYPPVHSIEVVNSKKEQLILSVGRFTDFHTAKKQHVLIEAFAQGMKDKKLKEWKLILAGGLLPTDQNYLARLKEKAKGLPIIIKPNVSHVQLVDYYRRASIYWHAAGYGETDPRWMEHFGITTVEAMSAGTVPVVFAGGGQREIVEDGKNGFLWEHPSDLLKQTSILVDDPKKREALRKAAIKRSRDFGEDAFCAAFDRLLERIMAV